MPRTFTQPTPNRSWSAPAPRAFPRGNPIATVRQTLPQTAATATTPIPGGVMPVGPNK